MSNALTVFQGLQLPGFLADATGDNKDFTSGVSGGPRPPRLSIEGKTFRIISEDGAEFRLTKTDEETGTEVPIQVLNVVLLAANTGKYKQFYGSKYDPKAETKAPRCFSYDGVRPSVDAEEPQAPACATCPQNVWGSAVTEQNNPTRACQDGKILAVMAASDVTSKKGKVYQIKVSPTALSRSKQARKENPANNTSLAEYIELLNSYVNPANQKRTPIPAHAVVTRLFFDPEAQYPLLRFKFGRVLTGEEFAYVEERKEGEDVLNIIAPDRDSVADDAVPPATVAPAAPVDQVAQAAAQAAAETMPKVEPAAQAAAAQAAANAAPNPKERKPRAAKKAEPAVPVTQAVKPAEDPRLAHLEPAIKSAVLAAGGPDSPGGAGILAAFPAPKAEPPKPVDPLEGQPAHVKAAVLAAGGLGTPGGDAVFAALKTAAPEAVSAASVAPQATPAPEKTGFASGGTVVDVPTNQALDDLLGSVLGTV